MPYTVNPVTGEMREVKADKTGKHTSGCMKIDERYLHAARDAGLGGGEGMYSHMNVLRRAGADVLKPSDVGHGASGPGDLGGGYKEEERSGKSFLYSANHKVVKGVEKRQSLKARVKSSKAAAAAPRKGGVRQVVQGRSRALKPSTSGTHASKFEKQKGVVATMGGAHNLRTAAGNQERLQAARKGSGRGGGSAGTNVVSTKKGGAIATLSHASERSCREGGGGRLRPGQVSGGVAMIAPKKPRPRASQTVGSARSTNAGRALGSKSSAASSAAPKVSGRSAPKAGRRASGGPSAKPKPLGTRNTSTSTSSGGSSRSAGAGAGAQKKKQSAKSAPGAGSTRVLGGHSNPQSAADLRAARAAFFAK